MDLFNLVARITLDSSEYSKQLGKAENTFKSFGSKLKSGIGTAAKVGGAAVAAVGKATVAVTKSMASAISETAAYGDTVEKMSQKLGLSSKAYQEWDYILKISGSDISSMSTGLKTLTNKFDEAKGGSDTAVETFKRLGLSMNDIKDLSREELFEKAIYAFQDMEDSAERAALANDLFGRSGQELAPLFNTSAEETKKLIKQVNELGGVMSNDSVKAAAAYEDSLTGMQTALSGLKHNVMSEFMPSITTVMDGISELFTTGGTDKIIEGIGSFVDKIGEVIPKILDVGGKLIIALADGIIDNLDPLLGSAIKIIEELTTSLLTGENINKIMGSAVNVIKELVVFLSKNVGLLIDSAFDIIEALLNGLTDPKTLHELVKASIDMIGEIVTGLIDNLPDLLDAAWELAKALADELIHYDWWGLAKKIFASLKDSFKRLFKGNNEPETPNAETNQKKASTSKHSTVKAAKGGIVRRPIIAGEAGAEAIVPLERNTEWIQSVVKQFQKTSGTIGVQNQTVNIPISLELDGTTLARKTYQYNLNETERHGRSLVNA